MYGSHEKNYWGGLHTSISHMRKHRSWIDRQCQTVEFQRLEVLDTATIEPQVSSIVSEPSGTPAAAVAVVFQRIYSNIKNIVSGSVDVLDILLADDALVKLYVYADQFDGSKFFEHLISHQAQPAGARIGAGTDGSTSTF